MLQGQVGTKANLGERGYRYERYRPEQTLLYQLVEEYYSAFVAQLAAQGTELPEYVYREFEDYLECGVLSMASCGFAVTPVMPNTSWPSVANVVAFAPAVGHGGW